MDNRQAERQDVELGAEVYTRSERIIAAGTENLCEDGVCLTLRREIPEGTLVGVSMFRVDDGIQDPDDEPVNKPAKVVWCDKKPGCKIVAGMRFVDPQKL